MRFSKRHKSRRMSSLQKVSRDLPNAKDGSSLRVVGEMSIAVCLEKPEPFWLDISMTYQSEKKDQGSNDNDQKSHFFFGWEENGSEVQRLILCQIRDPQ